MPLGRIHAGTREKKLSNVNRAPWLSNPESSVKMARLNQKLLVFALSLLWALQTQGAEVDYAASIKPVLAEHCYRCHGATQQKGSLRVDTAAFLLKGGDTGPGYIVGDPVKSLLIQAVKGVHDDISRMPYKKPPLADPQIAQMEQWIREGAKSPSDEKPESKQHWSFVAIERPKVPKSENSQWP